MFFIDPIYLLIILVGIVISGLAAAMVKLRYRAAAQVPLRRGLCGAEVAAAILRAKGIDDVTIVEHAGFLSDHYNPLTKTLALSSGNFRGRHAAAAGVAAHEVGHAIQHAESYAFLGLRSALVPLAGIGSNLGPWLVIAGIFLGMMQGATAAEAGGLASLLAISGVILFGCAALFTVVTLPVEFDASARAKAILIDMGLTSGREEDVAVRKVLSAAALTYVAAAVIAVLNLLYWAWRAGLIGGRR